MTVFSTGSYSGATTAEIAREAGVSEPILYRHFASKRELYFACLDEAWRAAAAGVRREDRLARAGRSDADASRDGAASPRRRRTCCRRTSGSRR